MTTYTFTDDAGTHESYEHPNDEAAIRAARKWAQTGIYPEGAEITVWDGDREVATWTIGPTQKS